MKKSAKIIVKGLALGVLAVTSMSVTSCKKKGGDEYTKDGKLILNLKNLYFNAWQGWDDYTAELEDKFNVKFDVSSYSWSQWDEQVTSAANGNNLPDVFHFDIDSYNIAQFYTNWAEGIVTKALPDDLSKWPNIQSMINNISNVDSLKYNGKLYGLPIMKDITSPETDFSPFTYVYRRDWAKKLGVYQENDEYTWEQFNNLLKVFSEDTTILTDKAYALGDVEWGYPSVTNFYKNVPHCFDKDASGKVISAYSTDKYLEGLDVARKLTNEVIGTKKRKVYGYSQFAANDGDVNKEFVGNRCGVFYENLSYSNYRKLRDDLEKSNVYTKDFNIDDASAIMKVKGPDGKYVLEGTENWFSMTFFNYDISDAKMEKILDIMDWLISEEGTTYATYGIEGYDYTIDGTGKVVIDESAWLRDEKGKLLEKENGAKYLRYMVTLGYDTLENDPLTDLHALEILDNWESEMKAAKAANQLRVLKEDGQVKWMSTPAKDQHAGALLTNANDDIVKYCYNEINKDKFISNVTTGNWATVLAEINAKLGK